MQLVDISEIYPQRTHRAGGISKGKIVQMHVRTSLLKILCIEKYTLHMHMMKQYLLVLVAIDSLYTVSVTQGSQYPEYIRFYSWRMIITVHIALTVAGSSLDKHQNLLYVSRY